MIQTKLSLIGHYIYCYLDTFYGYDGDMKQSLCCVSAISVLSWIMRAPVFPGSATPAGIMEPKL